MAADKPEFPHLLAPGRHRMSLLDVRSRCVWPFPESATRPRLMSALHGFVGRLEELPIRWEVWVDGSFVTEKPNPDDIDLTVVVDGNSLERLQQEQPEQVAELLMMAQTGVFGSALHVFLVATRPEGHPDHAFLKEQLNSWAHWWSVTRENWVKGFAVIRLGESDVALRILP